MKLSHQIITENFSRVSKYLTSLNVEALYLSGSDYYLSEYSAIEGSLRTYLTPFTGSTAEVLIIPHKKVLLFVDGRYHLQADLECKELEIMEVVKVTNQVSLFNELTHYIQENKMQDLGIVPERTQFHRCEKLLSGNFSIINVSTDKLEELLSLKYQSKKSEVYVISENLLPKLKE